MNIVAAMQHDSTQSFQASVCTMPSLNERSYEVSQEIWLFDGAC